MGENQTFKNAATVIILILVTLFLIKALDLSYPINITSTTRSSELAVVGEGKIEVTPDVAFVDAGITVNNVATVDEAQKLIDQTNQKILQALRKLGIDKGDIKTTNYSINPNYSFEGDTNRIVGYNGNVTITIKVRNIRNVSSVLEAAAASGANQIQGVRYSIDNPQSLREQARNKAIQNAKDQANQLAKSLGIRLGRVVNIVESSPNQPAPFTQRFQESALGGIGGAAGEVEPGTQTVTSVVTLYFEKR